MAVRNTAAGRSPGGQAFVISARTSAFNKLMGLSVASAYRQPQLPSERSISAEGKPDLSRFNG